jgi:hypothetical protein
LTVLTKPAPVLETWSNTRVPCVRLRDLRHTAATLMLEAGVPAEIASERLGHSSIAMTLDRYSHVTEGMQQEAVRRVASMMGWDQAGPPAAQANGPSKCGGWGSMLEIVASTILGAVISAAISWWFALRSSAELRTEAAKLRRMVNLLSYGMEHAGWLRPTRDAEGELTGALFAVGKSMETAWNVEAPTAKRPEPPAPTSP